MKKKRITHEQMNAMNWRYKKNEAPKDEFKRMNGPVKIIKKANKIDNKIGNRGKTPYIPNNIRIIMREED